MKKVAVSVAMVSVLAACGGGGDSSPDPVSGSPSVALTATNYEVAGKELLSVTTNVVAMSDFAGFLTGAEMSAEVSFPRFVEMKYPLLGKTTKSHSAYLSGVSVSDTEPCSGGGAVTISGNISNEDNPTPGDTITLSANNCIEDRATISGIMTLRVLSASGNFDGYPYSMAMEATTSNFRSTTGSTTLQSSGSITVQMSQSSFSSGRMSLTIPNMTSTRTAAGKTETFQYVNYKLETSVSGSTVSMTMSGGLSVPSLGSNRVTLQTLQPFVSTTSYPVSGVATATTASGGKMRFTASSGSRVLIELDAANDGSYETSKLVAWNEVF